MENKQQVVHIHGGMPAINPENFREMIESWSYSPDVASPRWHHKYLETLGDDFGCLRPDMPNKNYAEYGIWDTWFRKVIPFLVDDVVLIGHSLGGGFLMKWLSTNKLPVNVSQLHLVAPTNNHHSKEYDLGDFTNGEFPGRFLENNVSEIYFYHSKDDLEVPISESEKYAKELPDAQFHVFDGRGHFLEETFPELFRNIKKSH